MPKPSPEAVASQLEQLPLELFEPILANLTFRDIIALDKCAGNNSRLSAALATDPKWKAIWPSYTANKDAFQTLASMIVPISDTRTFDPTSGMLTVTPGQFHRRLTRQRQLHGPQTTYLDYVTVQTSIRLKTLLHAVDSTTLTFICQRIPLSTIPLICPWLLNPVAAAQGRHPSAQAKSIQTIRTRFYQALHGFCDCETPYMSYYLPDNNAAHKPCAVKHPHTTASPHWTVSQMKAFVDAYAAVQKQLNRTKAEQLHILAELYARHHTRLREPYAPQTPRTNPRHVPRKLAVTAGFVRRIVDIDRGAQRRTKMGVSLFRYAHACLVPYDWCLKLWAEVARVNRYVRGGGKEDEEEEGEDSNEMAVLENGMMELSVLGDEVRKTPVEIKELIEVVRAGMGSFYRTVAGQSGVTRTGIWADGTVRFQTQRDESFIRNDLKVRGGKNVYAVLPPIDEREMEWLAAFIRVVEWMEDAYPEISQSAEMVSARLVDSRWEAV